MTETATRKNEGAVVRLMGETYAPTGFKAVIKHNEKGYFAEIDITLTTSAWVGSAAKTRRQFLVDVYQSIADEYGVTGFTPEFVDEKGRAIVNGLDDLASDVLGEDKFDPQARFCKSNGCDNKLQQGDVLYCNDCSEEING